MACRLSLLAVALCLVSVDALGCRCPPEDKQVSKAEQVRREFQGSDFVAEIEVDSVEFETKSREFPCSKRKTVGGEWEQGVCNETNEMLLARFHIVKLWKGDPATTTVVTHSEWQVCGLPFRKGDRVLLYAYVDEVWPGHMATDSCGRTDLVARAKKDLKALRGMFKRGELPVSTPAN